MQDKDVLWNQSSEGSPSTWDGQGSSCGCCDHHNGHDDESGDVNQSNESNTSASSEINNSTAQGNTQSQEGSATA